MEQRANEWKKAPTEAFTGQGPSVFRAAGGDGCWEWKHRQADPRWPLAWPGEGTPQRLGLLRTNSPSLMRTMRWLAAGFLLRGCRYRVSGCRVVVRPIKTIRLPMVVCMVVSPLWERDGFVYECIEGQDRCQPAIGGGFRIALAINSDSP